MDGLYAAGPWAEAPEFTAIPLDPPCGRELEDSREQSKCRRRYTYVGEEVARDLPRAEMN